MSICLLSATRLWICKNGRLIAFFYFFVCVCAFECRMIFIISRGFDLTSELPAMSLSLFIVGYENSCFNEHCVKSVQTRSYFWSVFSCIRTEYRKLRIRNKSVFGHFSHSGKLQRWHVYFFSSNV